VVTVGEAGPDLLLIVGEGQRNHRRRPATATAPRRSPWNDRGFRAGPKLDRSAGLLEVPADARSTGTGGRPTS
jgi:hypothetical protein